MSQQEYQSLLLHHNFVGGAGRPSVDYWGDNRTSATQISGKWVINYHFVTSKADIDSSYYGPSVTEYNYLENGTGALTSGQAAAFSNIFAAAGFYDVLFSSVSNVSIISSSINDADIVIGQTYSRDLSGTEYDLRRGTAAETYTGYTEESLDLLLFGDIWVNNDFDPTPPNKDLLTTASGSLWQSSIEQGELQYLTLLHEVGHALGLAEAELSDIAGTEFDNQKYTVMSYNPMIGMGDYSSGNLVAPSGLQLLDIAAIQAIYGANTTVRNEDIDGNLATTGTTYGIGQGFGASANDAFVYTIWDGGGSTDVIDATGYQTGVEIDLREGLGGTSPSGGIITTSYHR